MLKPRKKDNTLAKIIFILLALILVGFSVYKAAGWLSGATKGVVPRFSAPSADALKQAADLYAAGDYAKARETLQPLAAKNSSSESVLLLAKVETAAGNAPAALALLQKAYEGAKTSPGFAAIAISYAQSLEAASRFPEAVAVFEEVRNTAPPELRAPALTGLGRQAERDKDLIKARDLFRQAVNEARWNSEAWNEAADALGRVNVTLIFSLAETPESKKYAVVKGDSITSIGNALNTTQGLLTRANGIDEKTRLNLGQLLKYTPKDFRIVIERSTCRVFLLDKDGLFKRYYAGLGKPGHETTLGAYKIGNKEKDPIWHKPGAGPIAAGDPANELGTRWMPLVPDQEGLPKDLGIHGTIRPETIGSFASNGCARMHKEDIEELYDLVVRATPVEIVDTFDLTGYLKAKAESSAA